jgi:eukaryotic-like serine/threonine-protein kinase
MLCPRCQREVSDNFAFCPYDAEPLEPPTQVIPFDSFRHKKTGMAGAMISNRFQIKGFVNKGSTSRVYLAEDAQSREQVVVKLFTPGVVPNEEAHARFQREAELLTGLSDPNIIKVLSFGELKGRPYVVTEPLRGESLGEYLRREGKMPTDLALTMMRHAALGLVAAHRAGIVHRDVKPGNLFLVGPIGQPYGLKLIDFGLAKGESSGRISEHDIVIGTVEYMAPEQIVGDPCDARADIYGLGVVMFRVFTGHLPFDVENNLEMLALQVFSPAPPPSWLNEEIDPRIERIISRATRKRPKNRHPSMEALLADIERVLGLSTDEAVDPEPEPADDRYEPLTAKGRTGIDLLSKYVAGES